MKVDHRNPIKKKYLVAKSDFHAKEILKGVYQGRIEHHKVLYDTDMQGYKRIRAIPLGSQELYSVYETSFDPRRIKA